MELKENEFFGDKNRYRLIRKLGSGGFSEVWLAEDTMADNMQLALKIYASVGGLDDEGVKMFRKEFALLFNMNHSNLLKPTHVDDYQNRPFLTMPFCENGSSNKLVGRMSEDDAWRFLHDVAAGLAYLHNMTRVLTNEYGVRENKDMPVIHQDISTENILMNERGDFLITDFGISSQARHTLRKSVLNVKSTPDTSAGGKVDFMAPELFGVKNEPIKASDIWAFGVTAFELLEGRLPFPIGLGGLAQKGGADIPEISGNYSQKLKDIVYKMLAKETWDRPNAETILQIVDSRNAPPTPQPQPTQTTKPQTAKIFIIIAAAVFVIAGFLGFWLFNRETPIPTVTDKYFYLHDRSFTYTGEINKEGNPHGNGKAVYDQGMINGKIEEAACTYEGTFVNGYRVGHEGKLTFKNEAFGKYEGEFVDDFMQGMGTYYWADSYFKGTFKENEPAEGFIYNNNGKAIGSYVNMEYKSIND